MTILKTSLAGLLLAAVMALAGCGDGGHHRMSYRGRDSYPTYSRSHDGGGGGHRYASRDDGWHRR
jgi:hypothetical protein